MTVTLIAKQASSQLDPAEAIMVFGLTTPWMLGTVHNAIRLATSLSVMQGKSLVC